jgi:hypothetical protein
MQKNKRSFLIEINMFLSYFCYYFGCLNGLSDL